MGAEKVTRRVLLTVGGLTLLGIYASDPAQHGTTQHDGAEWAPGAQPAGARTRRGILTTGGRPAAAGGAAAGAGRG